jgi:hypothetical protein
MTTVNTLVIFNITLMCDTSFIIIIHSVHNESFLNNYMRSFFINFFEHDLYIIIVLKEGIY